MKRIWSKHEDVEHFLFAEIIAASTGNEPNTEPLTPENASHEAGPEAADPRAVMGQPSPTGWY